MTETIDIFDIVDKTGWELTPEKELLFSSDHVLDAYLKGKEEGGRANSRLIFKQLLNNLTTSGQLAVNVFAKLEEQGLNPLHAYLRILDVSSLDLLITIPEDEFLDYRILKGYEVVFSSEKENSTDVFCPRISLCAVGEHFNTKSLKADGYILRAHNKANEEGSRRAQ